MYLSRLILDPRSRQVRSEMTNLYEMHRTVMKGFAGRLEPAERVLFRLEIHPRSGIPTLLVQSSGRPDWRFLTEPGRTYLLLIDEQPQVVENPAVKAFDLALNPGQLLAFRLRANPTVKKSRPGQRQGSRVGLVREEDQLAWLNRKLDSAGALLRSARVANDQTASGRLFHGSTERQLAFISVQFDGLLQVREPARLMAAVENGIGSAKGFGFGLLSLAQAS